MRRSGEATAGLGPGATERRLCAPCARGTTRDQLGTCGRLQRSVRAVVATVETAFREGGPMRVPAATVVAIAALVVAGCTIGGDGADEHGVADAVLRSPPAMAPDEVGAVVDLTGFHLGTMRLDATGTGGFEPGTGRIEIVFRSEDDGTLVIRGMIAGDRLEDPTVSFEVPRHVSDPAKRERSYLYDDGECLVRLSTVPEAMGDPAAGTVQCGQGVTDQHLTVDVSGSFVTG